MGNAATLIAAALLSFAAAANAAVVPGDLDGDGVIGPADEALFVSFYGGCTGDPLYDAAADLDDDGKIGLRDLALLTAAFGQTGDPDTLPPNLFLTVDDIPDDMNDLVVVPPGGFQITVHYDSAGGSVVDQDSLFVTSLLTLGPIAPMTNVGPMFETTPTRAVLDIAPDPSIALTTHVIGASIANQRGISIFALYAFAVRDFAIGAPMAGLQTIFLDFDQDRNLGPEIDFIESLRDFGLSSAAAPAIETKVRDIVVAEIVARTGAYFGFHTNGQPGDDPVNIAFTSQMPAVGHSRLCIGGQSPAGSLYLGAAPLDLHNVAKNSDLCGLSPQFGVFPHAMDNLWQSDPLYQEAFAAIDPSLGGVAIGDDPNDATLFDSTFDLGSATPAQLMRLWQVANALEAFSQTIASAIAHETGHMLGLSAPGAMPAGLYGGSSGGSQDHNVTPSGGTPTENFLMNPGSSFTFGEISGRGGKLPVFRPLSWAYLHDRVALNSTVFGLYLAPKLDSVSPNPVSYGGGFQTDFTLHGSSFTETLTVKLFAGGPIPYQVSNVTVTPTGTQATATINSLLVPPGTYDVQVTNIDGQQALLVDGLEVTL